jgi:hypothetical protein
MEYLRHPLVAASSLNSSIRARMLQFVARLRLLTFANISDTSSNRNKVVIFANGLLTEYRGRVGSNGDVRLKFNIR